MQLVTAQMEDFLGHSSAIRKMFEAGIELRKRYGAERLVEQQNQG